MRVDSHSVGLVAELERLFGVVVGMILSSSIGLSVGVFD